jgi:DNA-directed RNA polymerase subunit RPC12/RpoP
VIEPDRQITCIDCGGRAFLLTPPREDGAWFPGDIVAYRCQDCLDRWDLVLAEELDEEEEY